MVIRAGFWSIEPAPRGSQTWIGPQPRPVVGMRPVRELLLAREADRAAGVEDAAVVGHRQRVDLAHVRVEFAVESLTGCAGIVGFDGVRRVAV